MKTETLPGLAPRAALWEQTAADLMTPDVVSIGEGAGIREAVELLTHRGISGAPVIDDAGRPVGVVSRTDLLIHDRQTVEYVGGPAASGGGRATCVGDIMTPMVFALGPEAPARRVVSQMLDWKVHRLFVVDEGGVLIGVISALDVLSGLTRPGSPAGRPADSAPARPARIFEALTAADLMMPNPMSVRADATAREAIAALTDHGYCGAPVIDTAGRPIGVISRTNLIVHEDEMRTRPRTPAYYERADLTTSEGERLGKGFQVEAVDGTLVRDIMTPAVFSVTPGTAAAKVVEQMLALKIHRLFVVERDGALVGVISPLDVLRHLPPEHY